MATFSADMTFTDADRELPERIGGISMTGWRRTPCTACRYFCDTGLSRINIPERLAVCNQFKLNGG